MNKALLATESAGHSEAAGSYQGWFNPPPIEQAPPGSKGTGDVCRTDLYDCDARTILAVNVALATGRPILVSGPSGCGKTSLARFIGHQMDWEFKSMTITSRTQARDLLYTVDDLKRLQDARQGRTDATFKPYIRPGVLWQAFDRNGAQTLELSAPRSGADNFFVPERGEGTVVLLDEIDKADPDVPNNLLEPLGSYSFSVPELILGERRSFEVSAGLPPLIVLTNNDERRLPDAFLRRCVDLRLDWPTRERLLRIAAAHRGKEAQPEWLQQVLELVCPGDATPKSVGLSIAEFLDTVQACLALQVKQPGWAWTEMPAITVRKSARQGDE